MLLAICIFETENAIVLTAELPGIEDKDIEIKLEGNTLSLKGEHEHGVLKVFLPKKQESRPRSVKVVKPEIKEKPVEKKVKK